MQARQISYLRPALEFFHLCSIYALNKIFISVPFPSSLSIFSSALCITAICFTIGEEAQHPFVSVKDTGIGVSKEDQERIFERFYRVDKSRSKQTGGTGLGLAIVKHIAVMQKAELKIESELGKGTEIKILFNA